MCYASVAIAHTTIEELDRPFDYEVPDGMKIDVGSRVVVPFGRSDKPTEAYVVSLSQDTRFSGGRLKVISAVADEEPAFNMELFELANWMRHKYSATLYDCIRCIVPTGLGFRTDSLVRIVCEDTPSCTIKLTRAQQAIIAHIAASGGSCMRSELDNEFPKAGATIAALESKGAVCLEDASRQRNLALFISYADISHGSEGLEAYVQEAARGNNVISRQATMVVDFLMKNGATPVSDLRMMLRISMSPIKTLVGRGVIHIDRVRVLRNTVRAAGVVADSPRLTQAQAQAVSDILEGQRNGGSTSLLHGVTGSGKTEVYMRLIEHVLGEGKQVLVLVPEISLTPQTVNTFIDRFGEKVSVTHSRLSLGERYDQWRKARDADISIMIGPRSAVFTPFERLGLIIIDEEHEKTYKSEANPKFSALEVAQKRAELGGGFVVMGSATPQIETYYSAMNKKISLHTLPERINQSPPDVRIVDMRLELASGNTGIFSLELLEAIKEELRLDHQIILFLNRRGFSTFVCCRACGFVLGCDNCSINYTYHELGGFMMCHYCGAKRGTPKLCDKCGSKYIRHFGIGTQKLEAEVKRIFGDIATIRMDADTTSGKHSHEEILARFRKGESQILIGTQMIAKGLDFPRVTLVGVVAADLSLHNEDFRCAETTFQLLTQVSGRAGRAELGGRVFIQTYNPSHYAIKSAKTADYEQFYEQELAIRRQLRYPPFTSLYIIMATSENEKTLVVLLNRLRVIMDEANTTSGVDVLGPAPASVSKIRRRFRWRILVKHEDEELLKSFVLTTTRELRKREDTSYVNISITPNPLRI